MINQLRYQQKLYYSCDVHLRCDWAETTDYTGISVKFITTC